jgi:hypothetical protein
MFLYVFSIKKLPITLRNSLSTVAIAALAASIAALLSSPLTLHSPRMPRKLPFYAPPMPRLRTSLMCRRTLPEVVGAAAVKLTRFERDRALVKPTESLAAYEYVLRGRKNFSSTRSGSAPASSGPRALLRPVKGSAR